MRWAHWQYTRPKHPSPSRNAHRLCPATQQLRHPLCTVVTEVLYTELRNLFVFCLWGAAHSREPAGERWESASGLFIHILWGWYFCFQGCKNRMLNPDIYKRSECCRIEQQCEKSHSEVLYCYLPQLLKQFFKGNFFTLVCHWNSALFPTISSMALLSVCKSSKGHHGYSWAMPAHWLLIGSTRKKTFISSQSSDTVSLSTFPKGWWHMESDAARQCDGRMVPTCPDCTPEARQSHRRCSAAGKHSAETLTAQLQPCCGRWASRDCPYQHHYLSMLFTLVSKWFLSQADRNILFSACCRAG